MCTFNFVLCITLSFVLFCTFWPVHKGGWERGSVGAKIQLVLCSSSWAA